jgi:serine/threonine protein kinase
VKLDKYALGKVLAETANSVTFIGEDTLLHKDVAVKVVNHPSCDLSQRLLQNEISRMRRSTIRESSKLLIFLTLQGGRSL